MIYMCFIPCTFCIPYRFYLCRTIALQKLMLFVDYNRHEIKFILSYLILPSSHYVNQCWLIIRSIPQDDILKIDLTQCGRFQSLIKCYFQYSGITWACHASNHQPLDSLFNSLSRIMTTKPLNSASLTLWEGNPSMISEFPHKGPVTWKHFHRKLVKHTAHATVSWPNTIMTWCSRITNGPFYHWSLWMDKLFHPTLYWACDYLSMLGSKLIHVCKRGPRSPCHLDSERGVKQEGWWRIIKY